MHLASISVTTRAFFVLLTFCAPLTAPLAAQAQADAYSFSGGQDYVQNNSLGFTFTPKEDITVTALGDVNLYGMTAYGLYGNANHDAKTPYTVTVCLDATTSPGTHLAQQSITVDDKSASPFAYVTLPKPVALAKGTSYTIYSSGTVPYGRGATVTPDARVGFVTSVFDYHQGFPTQKDIHDDAGVSFQFTDAKASAGKEGTP